MIMRMVNMGGPTVIETMELSGSKSLFINYIYNVRERRKYSRVIQRFLSLGDWETGGTTRKSGIRFL